VECELTGVIARFSQVMYSHFQSFLLVALTARLGVVVTMCLTSMWAVPQMIFLVLFADLPLPWKFLYALVMLPLMAFFMIVDLCAQVQPNPLWPLTPHASAPKQAERAS
jgi:hypothetical protein